MLSFTGIMGREAAYSGRTVEWDQLLNSEKRLGRAKYAMGEMPFPEVPMPGQYTV